MKGPMSNQDFIPTSAYHRAVRWSTAGFILLCLLYVAFAITPSSYALAFQMLGLEPQGLLLGKPRAIRSDEWIVLTPYYQIAVNNGLGSINELSPYRETLRSFQALPILDWGMIFKPYHWGFLILPAANAFSLYFLLMTLSFLGGWAIFFRLLRLPIWSSLLLAATLYFSPMIQAWWTSNAGVFALAPWVMIAWIQISHRLLRVVACAYALLVWMLSCAYPPFLYAIGFAMAVLVICFRMDTLRWARVADGIVACAIALPLFIEYFDELIEIMQATVYPGQRISTAGGLGWPKLFAHFFPSITTRVFEPLASIPNSNASEITVLSSLLPLYAICLLNYQALARVIRNRPFKSALLLGCSLFLVSWVLFYMPPIIAKLSGLSMVPPNRAVLGLGLLLNVVSVLALAKAGVVCNTPRLLLLLLLTLAGTAGKLTLATDGFDKLYSSIDAIPYFCLLAIAGYHWRHRANPGAFSLSTIMTLGLAGNLLAYGLFNPVQSAYPIFAHDKALVSERLAERGAQWTPDGAMVVPGHYGALLAGIGLPTINHVLYYPQLDYFRARFPSLDAKTFNDTFNRYAHISVGNDIDTPVLLSADHVQLPMSALTGKTDKIERPRVLPRLQQLDSRPANPTPSSKVGHVDSMTWLSSSRLELRGWIHAPTTSDTEIRIWSSTAMEIDTFNTHDRPDVASIVSRALLHSGVEITLLFNDLPSPDTVVCIAVESPDFGNSTIHFPDGKQGCTQVPH